jgi:hypothetical protein
MRNIYLLLLIIPFYLMNTSCSKENSMSNFREDLWNCNNAQNKDSITLASNLTGKWKWIANYSYWSGRTSKADKDVQVVFTTLGTYTVTENSIIICQGNWSLEYNSNKTMSLILNDFCYYIWGTIYLCDNRVMFNDSEVDGDDNLFIRL